MQRIKLAIIPIIAVAAIIISMKALNVAGPIYNPTFLLFALNTLFITIIVLFVTLISAISYLKHGIISTLLLGTGLLISALVSFIAGWAVSFGSYVNFGVTVYNVGMMVFAGLQLQAGLTTENKLRVSAGSLKVLSITLISAILFVLLVSAAAWYNLLPPFILATGPTIVRQFVLGLAIFFLALGSLVFLSKYSQLKSEGLYWYALGLGSFAIGLFGIAIAPSVGDLIGWTGRIAQYLGGILLLVALLRLRSSSEVEEALSGKWAEIFRTDCQQFENLFARMLNGFAYHKIIVDDEGKPIDYVFLSVNKCFEDLTGLKKDFVIGKRVTEVLPNITNDPANWIGVYGKVALTGQPTTFENYSAPLTKWYSVSAYSPRKGYFVAIFEDITERKQAIENLVKSEQRWATTLSSIGDAVIATDTEGKITFMNNIAEALTGWSLQEALLKPLHEVFHVINEQTRQEVENPVTKVFESGTVVGLANHSILIRRDGSEVPIDDSGSPIKDQNGQVTGVVLVFHDITERKKADEELDQHRKHLEELVEQRTKQLKNSERLAAIGATAGMVGHDIRNPLQAIISDIYLAKTELATINESEEKKNALDSLEEIEKNVDYINKIVQDLQDYARPLNPNPREADLKFIIDKIIQKNSIPKNVIVSVSVEDSARKVVADADYLTRILYNLVINAVQALPKGGKLSIAAHKEVNDIVIAVKDTGIGIPKDIQRKMFTPMFTTKSKGQGFGLPVVKRMTESLGGTVSFDSEKGKGTKFIIRLPLQSNKR